MYQLFQVLRIYDGQVGWATVCLCGKVRTKLDCFFYSQSENALGYVITFNLDGQTMINGHLNIGYYAKGKAPNDREYSKFRFTLLQ